MVPTKRYAKKQAKARLRRRLKAHEHLDRERRQARRAAEAWTSWKGVWAAIRSSVKSLSTCPALSRLALT